MEASARRSPVAADLVHLDTITSWLRKHGKSVRPRLDRRQLDALQECFDIIDTDGTGTITAEELQEVFKVSLTSPSRLGTFIRIYTTSRLVSRSADICSSSFDRRWAITCPCKRWLAC